MTPRNPTNSDLLKEIRAMQAAITKNADRIERLEVWKIATDASNAAVEKYKHDRAQAKEDKSKMEVFQALLPFLIALTALAYGIITYLEQAR